MNTLIVLFLIAVERGQAQYSNVRYQPETFTAGFKPTNEFNSRQESPVNYYRVPDDEEPNTYGIPADSYQVPSYTYMTPESYTEVNQGNVEVGNFEDNGAKSDVETVEGAYYVLLPGSQLQRVQFRTENDVLNMAYTARLQYRNEDRAPIFVYTPEQYQQTVAYVSINKE